MKRLLIVSVVVFIGISAVAQTEVPTPAVSPTTDTGQDSLIPRYEDNVRPLNGVQSFDLGTRMDRMNVLIPTFTFSEAYGTNPGLLYGSGSDNTVWGSTTNIGGSLDVARGNVKQLFKMSYRGSAQINSYNSDLNTQIHSLEATESFTAGRWTYVIGDTLSYQPTALGAYGALLFPGSNIGTPGSDINPVITPDSSILSQQNRQLSNTVLGQVSYGLSRTSVLTGNVSYGTLRYLDGEFWDTNQFNASGSYDRRLGRNTIGIGYKYSKFMYSNIAQDFDTNTVQLTYGRRLIGRISFNAGVGPTFSKITAGTISEIRTNVSAQAGLRYAGPRTSLDISYARAVTSGSGITPGALTDLLQVSAERVLTHTLSANLSTGYSHNSSELAGTDYNTVHVGAGISRTMGRYMTMSLGYRGQRQSSNAANADLSTHAAVVSFQWQFRPVRLQ